MLLGSTEVVQTNATVVEQKNEQETKQPTTNEATTQDVQESKDAKQPDLSSKFAALARKERMARQIAQQTKQREAQLIERERQLAERERVWNEEFEKTPLEALKKRGKSYEDLTRAALNDGRFDPETEVRTVKQEIDRLRQEQAEREKRNEEIQRTAQQQLEQETIERFKESITDTVEQHKDKYELIHLFERSDLVFDVVEEHYERTKAQGKPKVLSIHEACDLVEKFIEEEIERTASTSKKFQSKYVQNKPVDTKQQPKSSTTINNSMQPTTSAAPSLLSANQENDRIRRALAALGN